MPRLRRLTPITLLLVASSLVFVGCAPAPPERTVSEENFQEPATAPELFPEGTAEQNLPYFQESLRLFSVGDAPVEGKPIVDQLAGAGFDKSTMQVSFDRSKTDLVADSIYVSARFGDQCLLGQVVVADRSFVAVAEPAVGPEKNICLIGATRPIDW